MCWLICAVVLSSCTGGQAESDLAGFAASLQDYFSTSVVEAGGEPSDITFRVGPDVCPDGSDVLRVWGEISSEGHSFDAMVDYWTARGGTLVPRELWPDMEVDGLRFGLIDSAQGGVSIIANTGCS